MSDRPMHPFAALSHNGRRARAANLARPLRTMVDQLRTIASDIGEVAHDLDGFSQGHVEEIRFAAKLVDAAAERLHPELTHLESFAAMPRKGGDRGDA